MIGSKTIDNIKSMTAAVDKLTDSIKKATTAWGTFGTTAGRASSAGAFSSASGTGGVGVGSSMGLGTAGATFGGTQMAYGGARMLGGLGQAMLAPFAGAYAGSPDLGMTVSRAAGYYGAARFSGVNRTALQMSTMNSIGARGITSMGSDAAASAMLVNGIGYTGGSTAYNLTMREIGGAARYLNMSNEAAAAAIGGFQTGTMGGNLYQYGIHTIDPKTGRQLTTGQIARQLYSRMFMGQKVSAADVRGSLQYGFAGANLRNMGFSSDQQEVLRQAFVDISQGRNPDLANKQGAGNPMAAQYQINTSQTNLMQRAEQPMLEGFQQAATAVTELNKAMEGLPDQFFQLKGALQGFLNSDVGKGSALATGMALGGLGNMAGGALTLYGGAKMLGAVGGKIPTALKAVGKTAGVGLAASAAGMAVGYGAQQGTTRSKIGSALTGAGTGATIGGLLGSIVPVIGTGVGMGVGAAIGGLAGAFTGGGNPGFGASFGPAGGSFEAQSPVQGVAATTKFGAKNPNLWKAGHTGQDYPVPIGTTVYAAADGIVMGDNPGAAYGLCVMIDHGNGYQTLYGHLDSKSVNVGDQVTRGQAIGKSGDSGNVTGPHLHFEVRKGKNNPVDPQEFLSGNAGGYGAAGSNNVLSSVVGGASAIDLSGGYSASSQLFSGSVASTLRSSAPSSGDSGSAGMVLGTGDQKDWATKFLAQLGVPITSENLKAMTTWMAFEGGHWKNSAHYNPLNTTQGADGASSMNKVGVKSYNSWEQGLQATVETIRNGRYGNVLQALQSGTDASAVLTAVNRSPWGTNIPGYGGGNAGFGGSFPGANGTTHNTVTIHVQVASASDAEAIKFAKQVKNYLDTGKEVFVMGSN